MTQVEPVHHRYARDEHCVSRKEISKNAQKVLYRLHNAGYRACLVGGGVRDILLGLHPKDFDVATDASPEEVKKLFRNCRLIGRRFRLAHIVFGRDIIEVATFRGFSGDSVKHSDDGMILRDNHFGTIEQDAIRRDFTVNALFYDIADFSVHDFCNGMEDLENRLLRLIGDPEQRYREDPVRMLRAIRLSVKLDLDIEENTANAIPEQAHLLSSISSARLWDESHKMFLAGHARDTFAALEDYELTSTFLPEAARAIEEDESGSFRAFIEQALINTDERVQEDKPVNPAFLYACFLWQPVQEQARLNREKGMRPAEAMNKAMRMMVNEQNATIAIPKRFSAVIHEIWSLQYRLESRRPKNLLGILNQPRFRAAYDFLLLRAGIGEVPQEIADWWTKIQTLKPHEQSEMVKQLPGPGRKRKPRRRKPKNNQNNS